jgi:hypothetical protein
MAGAAMLSPSTGTLYVDVYDRTQYRYHFTSSRSKTQFAKYYAPRRVTLRALGHTVHLSAQNECYDPFVEGPQTLWNITVGPPSAFIGKRITMRFTDGEGHRKFTMKVRRKNVQAAAACGFTSGLAHASAARPHYTRVPRSDQAGDTNASAYGPPASVTASPIARAAHAWPVPSLALVGEDENMMAEVTGTRGLIYFFAEGRHITNGYWTMGQFRTVRMHRGFDPIVETEPVVDGTVSWIGSSGQKGIVHSFQNDLHRKFILRLWDHTTYAKYVAHWNCTGPTFDLTATCKTSLKRVYVNG